MSSLYLHFVTLHSNVLVKRSENAYTVDLSTRLGLVLPKLINKPSITYTGTGIASRILHVSRGSQLRSQITVRLQIRSSQITLAL